MTKNTEHEHSTVPTVESWKYHYEFESCVVCSRAKNS